MCIRDRAERAGEGPGARAGARVGEAPLRGAGGGFARAASKASVGGRVERAEPARSLFSFSLRSPAAVKPNPASNATPPSPPPPTAAAAAAEPKPPLVPMATAHEMFVDMETFAAMRAREREERAADDVSLALEMQRELRARSQAPARSTRHWATAMAANMINAALHRRTIAAERKRSLAKVPP